MSRSIKKGPFVHEKLLKRIEEILTTQSSDQLQKVKIYPKFDVVSLKVKDLSFYYPDSSENLVLKGINFEIKRGEIFPPFILFIHQFLF